MRPRATRALRGYFRTHPHDLVECGDLATGRDADTPGQLGELGGPQQPLTALT